MHHRWVRLNHCQQFGMKVKELRAEAGLTQEELAERVGVFRTYMSRIETGEANPTLTAIHAVAGALSVEVQRLFEPLTASPKAVRTRAKRPASRGRVER
jgi:transcriptional regulator with XRE-family HTH domain